VAVVALDGRAVHDALVVGRAAAAWCKVRVLSQISMSVVFHEWK
jgi:hypothetical protein